MDGTSQTAEADANAFLAVGVADLGGVVDLRLEYATTDRTYENSFFAQLQSSSLMLNASADFAHLGPVDLYAGDFLEGFALRDAPEFEDWAAARRERLRGLLENSLYELGLRYGAAADADWAKSMALMNRLLQLDPYREEAYRHLMNLLARSGQRNAALEVYAQCRDRLAADLGLEPMPETTALYERIKGSGAPRQAASHHSASTPRNAGSTITSRDSHEVRHMVAARQARGAIRALTH